MAGAEAAPIEIFIGNTNPHATPDIIKEVLVKYAGNLPDKPALNVIEVKCLNNLDIDPNPAQGAGRSQLLMLKKT